MIRFPSFQEYPVGDHGKTASESLKDILVKFPSSARPTIVVHSLTSSSSSSSSSSSTSSSHKRENNASDYKWINASPRSSASSASSGKSSRKSSLGGREPDNPKLREECKEEVKNMEKGGGKGSWSAWKAGELARLYEKRGGGYKDTGDNKNKAQKGAPERKDEKKNEGSGGGKKGGKK